ncbi:MAG: hypothetical protein JRM82_00650 [Nitrososphaerota archaeon]|nr:hypothetical protein [Nitrososphaerota archaeon]
MNSSELRLFIPKSIYTDLKEIYQVDLPAYLAAFDRCYRAILLTIREYIVTSSVNTRDIDAGRLDEFVRNRIYDYFRTYFIEGWEGLKSSFKTQEGFKHYVSNLVPQIAQGANQLCGAVLPANFLDLMKDHTDTLQEMRECRMARDDLFKICEKVSKELENQIRQPWKV